MVEAHQRGASLAEIEALYLRDRLLFVKVAAKILGDVQEASDVVQDAFASAVRGRDGFRRSGPLEAWVWRLVVNAARSNVRRDRDMAVGGELDTASVLEERDPRAQVVRNVISQLPERQRLALFLRYYADLDYAAIAIALDMRKGTVSSTLSHAHRAVRDALSEADR